MGIHRNFYTEIKFNQEWRWCDPPLPQKYDKNQKIAQTTAIWGKSWLYETTEKAEDLGRHLSKSDLSQELASYIFRGEEHWDKSYQPTLIELTYRDLCEALKNCPNGYEFHAFVEKQRVQDFEIGESFGIYKYLSASDFNKLSKEAQKAYQFYEWDDPDGWVQGFKLLKRIMQVHLSDLDQAGWEENDIKGARFVVSID